MNLDQALNRTEFVGLSDSDALAAMLSKVTVPADSTAYSYSGLAPILAEAECHASIMLALRTFILSLVGGDSLDAFLLCDGKCDFTNPGIQAQLAANFQLNSDPVVRHAIQAMIDIGSEKKIPVWTTLGIETEPTLEAIAAARPTQRQRIAHFVNEILMPALGEESTTIEQIQALVANDANWNL
jgi:hypothetical protein